MVMDLIMELPSDSPATPNFSLRFERPEWTCVPVKLGVMDIQWGVALRAPVQGPMKHHMQLAVWNLLCADLTTACSSASI
jgi:hypothetical protein